MSRRRPGAKLRPSEERRIPIETGFCLVGKCEQVSNSGRNGIRRTTPFDGNLVAWGRGIALSLGTGWCHHFVQSVTCGESGGCKPR